MIEQSLFNSNFLGRDGFKWWVGQVADPEISGWGKTTTLIEDEDCQYYRVKVRILGYHPASPEILPDKDLPFAHVLVPLTEGSGVNGIGKLHQIQGGETVLGFFMDGDDGQQPVIFSAFYRQKRQPDAELFDDDPEDYSFRPYSSEKRITRHAHLVTKNESNTQGGTNAATGISSATPPPNKQPPGITIPGKTKADAMFDSSADVTITIPSPCNRNSQSQIRNILDDFMKFLRQVQEFNSTYVNPTLDAIVNLDDTILLFTKRILGVVSGLVEKGKQYILDFIGKTTAQLVGTIIPKSATPAKRTALQTILQSIICLFENLLNLLFDLISNLLRDLVGRLFDVVQCTVDNFLSNIFSAIEDFFSQNISPALDLINDVVGGGLGQVNSIISQALQYAGLIGSVLDCGQTPCPPESTWSSKSGINLSIPDSWNETLDRFGSRDFTECNNELTCSSEIQFVGGGGFGALANLIVNDIGSIIGVDVIDGGTGYVDPPFVSIQDNCSGSGGRLIPIIDNDGKVIDVVVEKSGDGYSKSDIKVPADIIVGAVSNDGLTTENRGQARFKVSLSRQPTSDVTLSIETSDVTEGRVTPSILTIPKNKWFESYQIRVTGVDDTILDGDIGYRVIITASSLDKNYSNKVQVVELINVDNELGGGPSPGTVPPSITPPSITPPGTPPGTSPVTPDTSIVEFDDTPGNQDLERGIGPNSKCGFIHSIYIKNPGYNYSPNDEVFALNCNGEVDEVSKFKITTGPGNSIIKVDVITSNIYCGCAPTLLINSSTGSGAVLLPVMRYRTSRPVGSDAISKVKVINCVRR